MFDIIWLYTVIPPSSGGWGGVSTDPEIFQLKKIGLYMYIYIYIYTVESGTGGCGQVHANQLKRTFPCFFSPQALLEKFLRGGGAKP